MYRIANIDTCCMRVNNRQSISASFSLRLGADFVTFAIDNILKGKSRKPAGTIRFTLLYGLAKSDQSET
jgi:hypothetical protein